MKSIRTRCIGALLGLFALTGVAGAANVEDIVRDTQWFAVEDGKVSMVWWIPPQFWEESLRGNPGVTDEMRRQVIGIMSEYTVVAMLRAIATPAGIEDMQSKEELLKNARIEFGGKVAAPLPPDQISPAAQAVLAQLKPVLAATAGPVGQGLEFVVYPGKVDGKVLADAELPGSVVITFYGKTHRWRLPLGSVLPSKTDKKTGEEFPGNYQYNPFTGGKLDGK
jgi:nucleotide-binding universal stress UspA family protein